MKNIHIIWVLIIAMTSVATIASQKMARPVGMKNAEEKEPILENNGSCPKHYYSCESTPGDEMCCPGPPPSPTPV